MILSSIGVLIVVIVLAFIYFRPYRQIRAKIFKKLIEDTSEIKNVEFSRGNLNISFQRMPKTWMITNPIECEADLSKMTKLMLRLMDIEVIDRLFDKDPSESSFATGKNGTLNLNYGNKNIILEFGGVVENDNENIYLKKSDCEEILIVQSSILNVLPKDVDDFRRTALFNGFVEAIRFVEAKLEKESYLISKSSDRTWTANGKEVTDEKANQFVEGLLEMRAEAFADPNIKLPAKESGKLTVKSNKETKSRYFFSLPEFEGKYLVPVKGQYCIMSQESVKKYFDFESYTVKKDEDISEDAETLVNKEISDDNSSENEK